MKIRIPKYTPCSRCQWTRETDGVCLFPRMEECVKQGYIAFCRKPDKPAPYFDAIALEIEEQAYQSGTFFPALCAQILRKHFGKEDWMIKTQEQFLQEALELKKQNPEMDIHICVSSDEILEDCTWTAHKIGRVEISPWFEDGEQIIIDEDQIKEHFEDLFYEDYENNDARKKAVDRKYDAEVKKAICIYTYAG